MTKQNKGNPCYFQNNSHRKRKKMLDYETKKNKLKEKRKKPSKFE
jgi:hypothetical protein